MTIQTISITGDAILFIAKDLGLPVSSDANCQFVRVDQNTREVFIDYSTDRPSPKANVNEAAWREVDGTFYTYHVAEGLRRVRREAIASARQPNPRPPGVADNWWYGQT